jgi:hypothetical protein
LIFLFLLMAFSTIEPDYYRAIVIDAKTNKPLSNIHLIDLKNKIELITDEKGQFKIPGHSAHFIISTLGHNQLELSRNALDNNNLDTIRLSIKDILLPEINIKPSEKIILNGVNKKVSNRISCIVAPGIKYAIKFSPMSEINSAIIDKINIKLGSSKKTEGKLRIRLVAVENEKQTLPSNKDLMPFATEYSASELSKLKDHLLSIDLNQYNISIPDQGFFVLIEGLPTYSNESRVIAKDFDKKPWEIITATDPNDPATYRNVDMNAYPSIYLGTSKSSTRTFVYLPERGNWLERKADSNSGKAENIDVSLHLYAN